MLLCLSNSLSKNTQILYRNRLKGADKQKSMFYGTDVVHACCREGTFQLIETGEPFYPRHLSEESKDFMRKVAHLPQFSCTTASGAVAALKSFPVAHSKVPICFV